MNPMGSARGVNISKQFLTGNIQQATNYLCQPRMVDRHASPYPALAGELEAKPIAVHVDVFV